MAAGMPLFSKRVLPHVHCTEQFGDLCEKFVHGEGVKSVSILAKSRVFCYNNPIPMSWNSAPTQANPPAAQGEKGVLVPALAKLGMPVLIFGGTFLVIAVALSHLVSPDRFPVRVGDKVVRLVDLESEERALKAAQAELLADRQELLKDADTTVLHRVATLKSSMVSIGSVMMAVDDVRRSFRIGSNDPIAIPSVSFDGTAGTLTLGGTVHDMGGRSIQVLASFVDGLRKVSLIKSVSEPEYTSVTADDGSTTSPFTLTITLNDAS